MNGENVKLSMPIRLYMLAELCLVLLNSVSIAVWTERACCFIQFSISLLTAAAMLVLHLKYGGQPRDRHAELLFAAMMALAAADFFLCFVVGFTGPKAYTNFLGGSGFIVVEVFLALYLGMTRKNNIARAVVLILLLSVFVMAGELTVDRFPIMFSYAFLTVNTAVAWMQYGKRKDKLSRMMALAMTGFFICDYGIMLRTFIPEGSVLRTAVYMLVWIAYTVMEVLVVLCYYRQGCKRCAA